VKEFRNFFSQLLALRKYTYMPMIEDT